MNIRHVVKSIIRDYGRHICHDLRVPGRVCASKLGHHCLRLLHNPLRSARAVRSWHRTGLWNWSGHLHNIAQATVHKLLLTVIPPTNRVSAVSTYQRCIRILWIVAVGVGGEIAVAAFVQVPVWQRHNEKGSFRSPSRIIGQHASTYGEPSSLNASSTGWTRACVPRMALRMFFVAVVVTADLNSRPRLGSVAMKSATEFPTAALTSSARITWAETPRRTSTDSTPGLWLSTGQLGELTALALPKH